LGPDWFFVALFGINRHFYPLRNLSIGIFLRNCKNFFATEIPSNRPKTGKNAPKLRISNRCSMFCREVVIKTENRPAQDVVPGGLKLEAEIHI